MGRGKVLATVYGSVVLSQKLKPLELASIHCSWPRAYGFHYGAQASQAWDMQLAHMVFTLLLLAGPAAPQPRNEKPQHLAIRSVEPT